MSQPGCNLDFLISNQSFCRGLLIDLAATERRSFDVQTLSPPALGVSLSDLFGYHQSIRRTSLWYMAATSRIWEKTNGNLVDLTLTTCSFFLPSDRGHRTPPCSLDLSRLSHSDPSSRDRWKYPSNRRRGRWDWIVYNRVGRLEDIRVERRWDVQTQECVSALKE